MSALRSGKAKASEAMPAGGGRSRIGERQEEGFALPMVLFIITILAVLGATSLTMAIYSMLNAQGSLPSAKAFDSAESGLSVAHSMLARDLIPDVGQEDILGSIESNSLYSVDVVPDPSSPEWKITSTGTYTDSDGNVYRRTLEEKITFAGTQKFFNALEYVLFAKNGNINITAGTIAGWNTFRVNGSIYAKNITLYNNKILLGAGDLYVNGNVYATNDATLRAFTGFIAASWTRVTGGTALHPALGEGVFANHNITLRAECIFLASSNVQIDDNCYYGNTISKSTSGLGINTIKISGTEKKMDAATGNVPDVALPEPDFDWYRAQAKIQDADPYADGQHYFPGAATINSLTIDPNSNLSSGWIGFCEGNLTIQNVLINANAKGVFVSMGNIGVTHSWQLQGKTEYQAIAKGKVTHSSSITLNLNPTDTIFIYSGYYNPANLNDYAVTYSLGMFRDIKGQITTKGSIYTPDADWTIIADTGITYKKPSVPVAGFPIPFQVKSWKEVSSP